MAANYTAHLTSVLVVLVVAFVAFVAVYTFLHCDSFTNRQKRTIILRVVRRSSICESSPRLRENVIFSRLRLHYSQIANASRLARNIFARSTIRVFYL